MERRSVSLLVFEMVSFRFGGKRQLKVGAQCVRVQGVEQEKESERLRALTLSRVTQIIVSLCSHRSPAFRQYERQ